MKLFGGERPLRKLFLRCISFPGKKTNLEKKTMLKSTRVVLRMLRVVFEVVFEWETKSKRADVLTDSWIRRNRSHYTHVVFSEAVNNVLT